MTGLAAYLLKRNPTWEPAAAETIARRILDEKREKAAAKTVRLATAQILLPLDGVTGGEEATHPFEQDDPTVNF